MIEKYCDDKKGLQWLKNIVIIEKDSDDYDDDYKDDYDDDYDYDYEDYDYSISSIAVMN